MGPKRPLKLKEIWGIRIRLELSGKTRDLAMFNLAIDSKLRGCDLMNLKVKDISHGTMIQSRAIIIQKKTSKPVQFEITEETRKSLRDWIGQKRLISNDFLFPSRVVPNRPLTTRQYARIVDQWVTSVGLDVCDYGTHDEKNQTHSDIQAYT
jgi:integrase